MENISGNDQPNQVTTSSVITKHSESKTRKDMRKVSYQCNLCCEPKKKHELVEMYWDGTVRGDNGSFGSYVLRNATDTCDKHICYDCINIIKSLPTTKP